MNKSVTTQRTHTIEAIEAPASPETSVVLACGLNRTEFNALRILLSRRLQRNAVLTQSAINPDLLLVDLDATGTGCKWPELRERYPNIPAICLSQNSNGAEGAQIIKRPAQTIEVLDKIEQVLQKRRTTLQADTPVDNPDSVPIPKRYNPARRLIGILAQAAARTKDSKSNILVESPGLGRFLFLQNKTAYTTTSWQTLRSLCIVPVQTGSFRFTHLSRSKVSDFLSSEPGAERWHQETLLWKIATHCSRGALPENIPCNTPLRIRYWPDCPRLPDPLEIVGLSALFSRAPVSVLEAARYLHLPVSAVSRYIAAMDALALIECHDATSLPKTAQAKRMQKKRPWSSKLLGALARRITSHVFQKTS